MEKHGMHAVMADDVATSLEKSRQLMARMAEQERLLEKQLRQSEQLLKESGKTLWRESLRAANAFNSELASLQIED